METFEKASQRYYARLRLIFTFIDNGIHFFVSLVWQILRQYILLHSKYTVQSLST